MDYYRFEHWFIPGYMKEGIENYLKHGISPGGFLQAVFENDFKGAFINADGVNLANLPAYASFMYNVMPAESQGSPKKVAAWIAKGGGAM